MANKTHQILVVDDEPVNLRMLERLLRRDYRVLTAKDGFEALEILKTENISVLISDQRMPGMTGIELLRQSLAINSDLVRMLVTASTENDTSFEAINSAGALRVIHKPWDSHRVLQFVEEALAQRETLIECKQANAQIEQVMIKLRLDAQSQKQETLANHSRLLQDMFVQLEHDSLTVNKLTTKLLKEIGDRTRTEEELRLQKILLESQSEASLDGVLVVSVEGKIISFNQCFIELWGINREMLTSRSGETALLAIAGKLDHPGQFSELVEYLREHPDEKSDNEIGLIDGRILHYYNAPVKSSDHVLYGRAYYFRDITERKQLENQLRQAQKLESVGQLAAGISHEINTPTQFVSDNTRFLSEAFQDLLKVHEKYSKLAEACRGGAATADLLAEVDAAAKAADIHYLTREIPKALEQSLEGTERISKIVQSMKDFAHPGTAVKQACDLNKAIDSTITIACSQWKYVAAMVTDFDDTLPLVPCLQSEFNQVVLNMIINASHAIGDAIGDGSAGKGTITISTRLSGAWAEIRIGDTGTGIPEVNRARIFDPFFTTKGVGKGTGQGLSISHNVVVQKHGGTITLETEEGAGTTFIIRLPLIDTAGTPQTLGHAG